LQANNATAIPQNTISFFKFIKYNAYFKKEFSKLINYNFLNSSN